MKRSQAVKLRRIIETAVHALGLEDTDALDVQTLYPAWSCGANYEPGQRVRYDGVLYRCLQAHAAQEAWTPAAASSLWARVLVESSDAVSEWVQPDSTNGYRKGDRVSHNGAVWVSICDANVWEPGVYGWEVLS